MRGIVIVMVVLVGGLAGVLAEYVIKRGGYGLRWDIILGLVGSVAGRWASGPCGSRQDRG